MSDALTEYSIVRHDKVTKRKIKEVSQKLGITTSDFIRISTQQMLDAAERGTIKLDVRNTKEAA